MEPALLTAPAVRLRNALVPHFPETATVFRRLVEAGAIPQGGPGFGGAHSAALGPDHAAVVLLVLGSGALPHEAPRVAAEMAAWPCVAYFDPPVGPSERREITDGVPLGEWLAAEIAEAAQDDGHRTCGLLIEPWGQRVSTIDPDELNAFARRGDGRRLLRDVGAARDRLEFGPAERVPLPRFDAQGRPLPAAAMRVLDPSAIRAVASAFAAARPALAMGRR